MHVHKLICTYYTSNYTELVNLKQHTLFGLLTAMQLFLYCKPSACKPECEAYHLPYKYMAAIYVCSDVQCTINCSLFHIGSQAPEVEFTVTSHSKCMCGTSFVLFELSVYWVFLSHSCVHKLP